MRRPPNEDKKYVPKMAGCNKNMGPNQVYPLLFLGKNRRGDSSEHEEFENYETRILNCIRTILEYVVNT